MAVRREQPKRKRPAQKPHRKYGFKTEKAYKDWIKTHANLSQSDPLYFRPGSRGNARGNDIARIKRMEKRKRSEAKNMRRKMNVLVYEKETMSPFNFLDRYIEQMQAMLADPTVSQYDKRIIRKIIKQLEADERDINEHVATDEQLSLFR